MASREKRGKENFAKSQNSQESPLKIHSKNDKKMNYSKSSKGGIIGIDIKEEIEKEIFMNIPNSLTLLRLALTFVFVYMLFSNYPKTSIIVVFAIAALTDWFDGFLARKLNQRTNIGARMDQVIDRVFTISIVMALAVYSLINKTFENTILLLFLIISREIVSTPGVLIGVIRGKDLYKVKYIGKLTTFIQGFALGAVILELDWAIYLAIPTCIIGIIAGLDYIRYSLGNSNKA